MTAPRLPREPVDESWAWTAIAVAAVLLAGLAAIGWVVVRVVIGLLEIVGRVLG